MTQMELDGLKRRFADMGATIIVSPRTLPRFRELVAPGVTRSRHRISMLGERFALALDAGLHPQVHQVDADRKHLVLQVEDKTYLCGHDERHWFVAGVEPGAHTVDAAMLSLMPAPVRRAVVKTKRLVPLGSRKNPAYLRQGEWFFVPDPEIEVKREWELHREPIRRGRSKPHFVERLYRHGGTAVIVCPHYPNGLTDDEWARSLLGEQFEGYVSLQRFARAEHGGAVDRMRVRRMMRDAEVHAQGWVKHPDHATITLKGWHRVYPSNEVMSETQAFLD